MSTFTRYVVEIGYTQVFDCEVSARNKEEAKRKAIKELDKLEDYCYIHGIAVYTTEDYPLEDNV